MKKKAFTLAEVLITLGVIGVVAAMTIPSLMSTYQKKVIETRYFATYSTLLQAFRHIQAEYDTFTLDNDVYGNQDVNGYSYDKSKDCFDKYFLPFFKGATPLPRNYFSGIYSSDGSTFLGNHFSYYAFYLLNNGTVLAFNRAGNYDGANFMIIFNPKKDKKLRSGKDVLALGFKNINDNGYAYNLLLSSRYNQGTRPLFVENCAAKTGYPAYASSPTAFCSELIVRNNFKIPSDYPIKF